MGHQFSLANTIQKEGGTKVETEKGKKKTEATLTILKRWKVQDLPHTGHNPVKNTGISMKYYEKEKR